MPIEREFGELDLGRIREGWKRTGKKFMVWIATATNNVSRIIEQNNRKEGDLIAK